MFEWVVDIDFTLDLQNLIVVIFVFFCSFKTLWKRHRVLLSYTFTLVFFLALIAAHRTSKYAIVYLPFIFLVITYGIREISRPDKKLRLDYSKRILILRSLFIVYLVTQFVYVANTSFTKETLVAQNISVANKYTQKGENIVGPMSFIFNAIEDGRRVQACVAYEGLKKKNPEIIKEKFIEATHQFDIDVILLKEEWIKVFELEHLQVHDTIVDFIVMDKKEDLTVLRRFD